MRRADVRDGDAALCLQASISELADRVPCRLGDARQSHSAGPWAYSEAPPRTSLSVAAVRGPVLTQHLR